MKTFFQEHFQEQGGFLEILKNRYLEYIFLNFSLLTYFPLAINY